MSSTEPRLYFEVERFIEIMKEKPALWDTKCADYSNPTKKREHWQDVCREMNADYDWLPIEKQTVIEMDIQKKWKGIRSCFARELSKKRKAKGRVRRVYIYFDQLTFLLPFCGKKGPKEDDVEVPENEDKDPELQAVEAEQAEEEVQVKRRESPMTRNQRKLPAKRPRTVLDGSHERLCKMPSEVLEHRIVEDSEDNDKSFLLSLNNDLKNLPPLLKMDAKMEIIAVLRKYTEIHNSNNP